jgi:hypothetical protein
MRLKEHPKNQWPPPWSEGGESDFTEEGILRDVDLIESTTILLSNEIDGEIYFAEINCFNAAFAFRLHEKVRPFVGRPIKDVGELDL